MPRTEPSKTRQAWPATEAGGDPGAEYPDAHTEERSKSGAMAIPQFKQGVGVDE